MLTGIVGFVQAHIQNSYTDAAVICVLLKPHLREFTKLAQGELNHVTELSVPGPADIQGSCRNELGVFWGSQEVS